MQIYETILQDQVNKLTAKKSIRGKLMDNVEKQILAVTFIGCFSTLQSLSVTSACTFHLTYCMYEHMHSHMFLSVRICNSCTHSRENTFIFLSMCLSLMTLVWRGPSSWTQTDRSPEAFQIVKTFPTLLHLIPSRPSWYQVYWI